MSVLDGGAAGFLGGLLLVNVWGRPESFHCTAPLQTTATQQILYGTTLPSFIYCDQLGAALLAELKTPPTAVMIQQPVLAELSEHSAAPLVLVTAGDAIPSEGSAVFGTANWKPLPIDGNLVTTSASGAAWDEVNEVCRRFASRLPLQEPFERLQNALEYALAQAR